MKLIAEYAKSQKKIVLTLVIFGICNAVTMMIFDIKLPVLFYGGVIGLFVVSLLGIRDFAKYRRTHEVLTYLKSEAVETLENLPEAESMLQEDYHDIIRALSEEKKRLEYEGARAYEEMCEYYTVWAHQIKTPIAAMSLILQGSDEENAEYRELADELFKIEQYVEMVLHYLRLDGDGSDFVIKEYDLDDIITQSVKKYATQFIRRRNRLDYRKCELKVITDEKWLIFVIEQVLSNALKYTSGGEIKIYLEESDVLVIKDTGIGIAQEDLPRIFEKGFTGYNGRADKKSTGIGLYLCRRIVSKLGCEISASSVQGEGTEIRIKLNITKM